MNTDEHWDVFLEGSLDHSARIPGSQLRYCIAKTNSGNYLIFKVSSYCYLLSQERTPSDFKEYLSLEEVVFVTIQARDPVLEGTFQANCILSKDEGHEDEMTRKL